MKPTPYNSIQATDQSWLLVNKTTNNDMLWQSFLLVLMTRVPRDHVPGAPLLHRLCGHQSMPVCYCVSRIMVLIQVGSNSSPTNNYFLLLFLTFNTKIDCLMRPWLVNNKAFKRKFFFEDFKWPFIVQMMSWHTALSHGY